MKLHRYFVGNQELNDEFIVKDKGQYHQWTKVLRYEVGREVVLFSGSKEERLYAIKHIGNKEIKLEIIKNLGQKLPEREVYLCFALLKKDKNEWVLQKATELGVSQFVPLITDRTEKTGWNSERAEKIVIEASEQCGRTDIPSLLEPLTPQKLIEKLQTKVEVFVAEQGSPSLISNIKYQVSRPLAVLVGPEGGWSDVEKQLFTDKDIKHLALSEFTLRAETACVTAAALLQ